MSDPAPDTMTSDAFLAWSLEQPKGVRYELVGGRAVRMSAERAAHARTKLRVAELMSAAVRQGGLRCEVFGDGMAVVVDELTTYEPDASLRCGPPLGDDEVRMLDPVVVVEIVSPSSRALDSGAKLADYFRIASVRHYLIVHTGNRTVIQHSRSEDGTILTRICRDGVIKLDPPGIQIAGLFD